MFASIVIGVIIFTYAGWTMYRFIQKSKAGKCSSCDLKKDCSSTTCHDPTNKN